MKTLKIVPALILAVLASTSFATEVTVGITHSNLDKFDSYDDDYLTGDDYEKNGFTIGLSRDLTDTLKGQVNYTKSAAGYNKKYSGGNDWAGSARETGRLDTLGIGVRYTPWKLCVEPFVDLGVNANFVKVRQSWSYNGEHDSSSQSESSLAPYAGIGVNWNIDKDNAVALAYHRSQIDSALVDEKLDYDQFALTYSRRF
jgi:hypothetical protein